MEDSKKLEPALCYVPQMLVDYLNKNSIRVLKPASFFMHGVCLLVDISGFTKLSEKFCDQGKGGIDDLQLATNGFMGQLVDIIYTFGGDIIKFAGDAIICVFSPDFSSNVRSKLVCRSSMGSFSPLDDPHCVAHLGSGSVENSVSINGQSAISPEVILRVMHCAKLLTEVQTDKLTVHVAMSCGEMCFGVLGGFENRWECLISGPCIHQLSGCLDDAPSKHAVMSRRCTRIVREALAYMESKPTDALEADFNVVGGRYTFSILPLPSKNVRIVSVSFLIVPSVFPPVEEKSGIKWDINDRKKLINQFVPLPIAEQLEQGANLRYLAEIREVNTMFMKWDSYDSNGKHRDLLELQSCFYQAQRILHTSGAYLRQFLVDDKGCVLIACWGMPHLSYLDNAHRAVTAAAQIRIACYQLGMNCSFGITTGDVYCGTVGSALRMEYAAIGSVVNMSARLMCKANGGILIDDATYNKLPPHDLISFLTLEPIKVKGRDEPLQVYSYIESGLKHTFDNTTSDIDIPQYCRFPLQNILLSMNACATVPPSVMSNTSDEVDRATCGSFVRRMFRHVSTSSENTLAVVLIEGKEGSGRTSVVTWLKGQAAESNIRTSCVRLNKKDATVEYGLFKKLFAQLMPKDLFLNNNVQRGHVQELLRLAFPNADRSVGISALMVLGITCFADDGVAIRYKPLSESSSRKLFNWTNDNNSIESVQLLQDSMRYIFTYLLRALPTLVIMEALELADKESLALLLLLGNLALPSVFVCTALAENVEFTSPLPSSPISILNIRRRRKDSMRVGRTAWGTEFRKRVLALRNAKLIVLGNYTPDEINKLLCVSLGVKFVSPEVSQLVLDFSGGSYFWVREILHFIKEHGQDAFMDALGEMPASAGAVDDNFVPFLRVKAPPTIAHGHGQLSRAGSKVFVINGGIESDELYINGSLSLLRSRVAESYAVARDPKPTSPKSKQLDHLLLIRFGNLQQEIQRILRKASVVGVSFSVSVLRNLLSPHLREHLEEYLETLVNQKWIYPDLTCSNTFEFVHTYVRQLLYDLTPPSERNNLHQLTAEYLLQTHSGEASQLASIWYHFKQFNPEQALEYGVRAASAFLESEELYDYVDCFEILLNNSVCCVTVHDIRVLQHLTKKLDKAVTNVVVQPEVLCRTKGWLWRLFVHRKCITENNSTTPRVTSYSARSNDAILNNKTASQVLVQSAADSVKCANELDRGRTRLQLLEKISLLWRELDEKYTELSASPASHDQSLSHPKDWQIPFLDISMVSPSNDEQGNSMKE